MALSAGTITIDGSGNPDAAGTMARAIYDAFIASIDLSFVPSYGQQATKQQLADLCNAIAAGVVAHIVANGEVTVQIAPGDAGLQRTPNPNDADTDTQGPSAAKTLATKGTIA